jgi:IMP dehydrogenase/GMP reductase
MPTHKVARDASSGRFISLREARRRPTTTVVETIHVSRNGVRRLKRRRSAHHLTEENQNRNSFKAGKDLRTAKGKNTGNDFKAGRDL